MPSRLRTHTELTPALLCAAEDGDLATIKQALCDNPEFANSPDPDTGWTMLHRASHFGYHALVQLLLKSGANPNIRDKGRFTPLHDAASGHEHTLPSLILLVEAGAELEARNKYLQSPLLLSIYSSNWPGFIYLLGKGANPLLKDSQRKGGLEIAVSQLSAISNDRKLVRQRNELKQIATILSLENLQTSPSQAEWIG